MAGPDDLSFLTKSSYLAEARSSSAGALLVAPDACEAGLSVDLLVCEDPYLALTRVLRCFHPEADPVAGVHPTAVVDATADIHATAQIGPYCVVGPGARVGARGVLEAFVYLGRDSVVGPGARLHAHVTIYDSVRLGAEVIVHSGSVIGSDGFGFAQDGSRPVKIPQVGGVEVGDRVEIGANCAIDRATMELTRIGSDTKLDNLVQVGHNTRIGSGTLLCGQVGISGSAEIGDNVVFAGQSGAAGHLRVGDRVQVAAKASVLRAVDDGQAVGGTPAIALHQWRRSSAVFGRLDELRRRVRILERQISELERDADEKPESR